MEGLFDANDNLYDVAQSTSFKALLAKTHLTDVEVRVEDDVLYLDFTK